MGSESPELWGWNTEVLVLWGDVCLGEVLMLVLQRGGGGLWGWAVGWAVGWGLWDLAAAHFGDAHCQESGFLLLF